VTTSLRLTVAAFGPALLLSFALGALAQEPPSTTPTGKGAGPRLGPITRVEITLEDRAHLDRLTQAGYDVSGLEGNRVFLYADSEELAALQAQDWNLRILESPKPPAGPVPQALGEYNRYTNMTAMLEDYAAAHPVICRKLSLGQSVRGRELWAMKITRHPDLEEDEPEVKFVSTLHGVEPECTEVCLYFIDHLLNGYAANDTRIVNLVNHLEIWVVPLMNPDGRESESRYNASGYDLNRCFPNAAGTLLGNRLYGPPMKTNGLPHEVRHVMTWTGAHSFTLATDIHSGALVINYPYDSDGRGSTFSPTPDEALLRALSCTYASNNPPMWANNVAPFTNGVVNGAAWYEVKGTMEDWDYRYDGSLEVLVELWNGQIGPTASQLPVLWSQNRESMLAYIEWALKGVRGVLRDAQTGQPVYGAVRVEGIHHLAFSDPDVGDYHRILLPGTYNLWFYAPGYVPRRVADVIVGSGEATRLNVAMEPVSARFAAKVNFQPASTNVPTGFLADSGAAFGDRENGHAYGWETELGPTNLIARRAPRSQDPRYDTFCRMQLGTNHVWEIAVPNGPHSVLIGAGDPSILRNHYQLYAEDLLLLDASVAATNSYDCNRWAEALGTVVVTDGRLTIRSGPDATNNALSFVELSALEPTTIDQWRALHFATIADAGPAASDADPDGDELPNLLEYAFGLSPATADPEAQLTPLIVRIEGVGRFGAEFLHNTNATDLGFSIQASEDLLTPAWVDVATYVNGIGWSGPGTVSETPVGPGQVKVRVLNAQPIDEVRRTFLRLQVARP